MPNKTSKKTCPYCRGSSIIKHGTSNNLQRYKCQHKTCGKTFTERKKHYTPAFKAEIIDSVMLAKSIRKVATVNNISQHTIRRRMKQRGIHETFIKATTGDPNDSETQLAQWELLTYSS